MDDLEGRRSSSAAKDETSTDWRRSGAGSGLTLRMSQWSKEWNHSNERNGKATPDEAIARMPSMLEVG
jgi:hypothetical protein